MHEIQRPAGGFVAWKMCENTHTMDAPGCAGEASMCSGDYGVSELRVQISFCVSQALYCCWILHALESSKLSLRDSQKQTI